MMNEAVIMLVMSGENSEILADEIQVLLLKGVRCLRNSMKLLRHAKMHNNFNFPKSCNKEFYNFS